MAKKNTTPEVNTATPPSTPPTTADTTKKSGNKPGRPAGQSTKETDVFRANLPAPEVKMAPQALAIAKLVEAAGNGGITRKELIEQMDGVVVTRQPQARILSYYQKALVDAGFFTVTTPAAAPEQNQAAADTAPTVV